MATARSLWPREHGAYAQLGAPLAAALASHTPTVTAWLFSIAACAAFLANEPLLIVLGHRGKRLREREGRRAWRRGAILMASAVCAGTSGLVVASGSARLACAVAVALGLALTALAWTRRQHSLWGELVAVIALPAAAVPVAVASGDPLQTAIGVSAVWALGFGCSVIAIHRVIARHRRSASTVDRGVTIGLAVLWLAILGFGPRHPVLIIAAPLVLASLLVAIWAPRATHLRAIGVGLVCAALAAGAIEVVTTRGAVANPAFDAQWHRPRATTAP